MQPVSLKPWLEHLVRQLDVAREGRDPEGVHQVRVAAGRLDVWLELAGIRLLRDDLAWLRAGASQLRELDVLAESKPPDAWLDWIEGRRAACRREFEAFLDEPRLAGLLRALPLHAPLVPTRAEERLAKLRRRARRRGARMEDEPADIHAFHRLRKALRRLRYALEWLGEDARQIKSLQNALGDLNDASVALALLGEWPGRSEFPELQRELQRRLEAKRRRSLELWKQSRSSAEETLA